jgi:hypothetical protein
MQLKTWKEAKGLHLADILEMLEPYPVRPGAARVSQHMNGILFPGPDAIYAYQQISEGAVTFDDFYRLRLARRAGRSVFNQEEEVTNAK